MSNRTVFHWYVSYNKVVRTPGGRLIECTAREMNGFISFGVEIVENLSSIETQKYLRECINKSILETEKEQDFLSSPLYKLNSSAIITIENPMIKSLIRLTI